MEDIKNQLFEFFTKIIIPALVGITIKLAVMIDRERITFLKVFISLIIGIGFVYLFQHPVKVIISEDYQPLAFGLIAMSGETFGRFLTKLWNLDNIIYVFYINITNYLTNLTGMKSIFQNIISTILGFVFIYFAFQKGIDIWLSIFFSLLGIILIFSKDTLFSKLGKLIDTVFKYFSK
jgi:hypothetical protein